MFNNLLFIPFNIYDIEYIYIYMLPIINILLTSIYLNLFMFYTIN